MATSPCAQTPQPCTGPGDCARCGQGWTCQNGRCAPAGPQQTMAPALQNVNPPQLERQAQQQQAETPNDRLYNEAVRRGETPTPCTHAHQCRGQQGESCSTVPSQGNRGYCLGTRRTVTTTSCVGNAECQGITCPTSTATRKICENRKCVCVPGPGDGQTDCTQGQQSCTGDASCASLCGAGWTCRGGICANPGGTTTSCTDDGRCSAMTCPEGQVGRCVNSVCTCGAPRPQPPALTPGSAGADCQNVSECTNYSCGSSEEKVCKQGKCDCRRVGAQDCTGRRIAATATAACLTHCGEGWEEEGGVCVYKWGTTQTETPDPNGEDEDPGTEQCVFKRCETHADCANCAVPSIGGQTAGQGSWECPYAGNPKYCTWKRHTNTGCNADADCPRGGKCHPTSKTCVDCLSHADCAGAAQCIAGLCEEPDDPGPDPTCHSNEDCEGNATCVDGQCVDPEDPGCKSDADCTEAPRTKCQTATGTCYDPGGPTPGGPCQDNSGCPEPQICVRGRCEAPTSPEPQFPTIPVPEAPTAPTLPTLTTPEVADPTAALTGLETPEAPTAPTIDPFDETGQIELPEFPTDPGTGDPLPTFTPPDMAALRNEPGYQFRLREGLKAAAAGMNAAGMLASGDAMKAFTRYAQDYATGEYEKAYNRRVDQYNRETAANKEKLRRKVDQYNRDFKEVLTTYNVSAQNFQRALQANTAVRTDILAKYGMDQQAFQAAMAAHGADRQKILDKYGISVDAFNRALAEHATARADVLAKFGMDQQRFNAMLEAVRTKLQLSEAEWGRWLSKFAITQGNLRGILGLA